MAVVSNPSPEHPAELLMIRSALRPLGVPVRGGRVSLGRLRDRFGADERLILAVGFATGCWIGAAESAGPELGTLR